DASSGGSATGLSWTIATATESGTTVTITTTAPHGLYVGELVTVGGNSVSGYNGTFTVTGVSGGSFTYTDATSGLGAGSGGTVSVALAGAQRSMVNNIVYKFNQAVTLPAPQSISTATESGTTVTITTAGAHGFARGQTVTVTGVSVAGYNGTFTITSVTGTTFTYTDSTSGLASGSGGNAQVGFTIAVHPGQTGN